MPLRDLVLNDRTFPITRFNSNALTKDACVRFGLDGVDLDTVHTSIPPFDPIFTRQTHGFIFYSPTEIDLASPITSSVGVRLLHLGYEGTSIEAVAYSHREYSFHPIKFSLPGTMGCTAAANLGFLLLKTFHGISTLRLGILILLDQVRLKDRLHQNLPVADDAVTQFCRERGFELIKTGNADSDCNYYPECQNQSGLRCDYERAECREKK